ncbi:LPXTG cell wall anchor domain-containing protein [Streptomyces sp. NPDC006711]|uniref:LPXTG cell wall anchor domain-containing protein n=1 Tax=Streptomyces sp. NPDC006711 TaxID=3364762 RepID=UPI003687D1CC
MNIRRIFATTVAAAVTAPAVLLSVSPAFAADTAPSSSAQTQKSTYADLKKAAADAARAYDVALKAHNDQQALLDKLMTNEAPEATAFRDAIAAADKAKAAETAADKAVTDAKAKLDGLPETASTEQKEAARKAVTDAEATAKEAAAASAAAEAKQKTEGDALATLRKAALRKGGELSKAKDAAAKAKKDAAAAFEAAGKCVWLPQLSSQLKGLPAQVVAGTSVDFSFQVTNGTDRTLDVDPLFLVTAKGAKAQWLDGSVWKELAADHSSRVGATNGLKPGSAIEVKVRLTVDAASKADHGDALIAGDASDAYNPCIHGPMKGYKFKVLPVGSKTDGDTAKPQPVDDKDRPKPAAKPAGGGSTPTAQGGAAATPLNSTTAAAAPGATGTLAKTGSSSAMPQLALAGGVAVALGAGAVVLTRRRKAADRT